MTWLQMTRSAGATSASSQPLATTVPVVAVRVAGGEGGAIIHQGLPTCCPVDLVHRNSSVEPARTSALVGVSLPVFNRPGDNPGTTSSSASIGCSERPAEHKIWAFGVALDGDDGYYVRGRT